MTRLDHIATHQRRSRVRDVAFALFVVAAGIVSLTTVSLAVRAAHVELANR